MKTNQLRKTLEDRLKHPNWVISYDRDNEILRIEDREKGKGINVALKPLLAKYERQKEQAIEDTVRYVSSALYAMKEVIKLTEKENHIFPVIRSASFPSETDEGIPLVYDEHTGETRIYYSVDLGNTYKLIDEEMIAKDNISKTKIKELALFNVRSLDHTIKEDTVAGNTFYFINCNDGYDASRILDVSLIEKMRKKVTGTMAVLIPHQDVLIFADIQNDTGYDVLAQIALQFFGQGRVPITALPFLYENGELEPTFILAQRKPRG